MGGAITRGLIAAAPSYISPCDIVVSNPSKAKLDQLARLGATVTTSNVEAVAGADVVIVCVKPWKVGEVMDELVGKIDDTVAEIGFVVAGVSLSDISRMLGKSDGCEAAFSIVMPNTAISCRESMTFISSGSPARPCANIEKIFALLGEVMVIDESLMPAATALASCGIAYALRYVRAATEGGVEMGFRAAEAQAIVARTLRGAAALLEHPGAHAEVEIDKVTTPGGLTIRGLNAMEANGFTSAVIAGLKASVKS